MTAERPSGANALSLDTSSVSIGAARPMQLPSPAKRKRSDSSAADTGSAHTRVRTDREPGSPSDSALGSESPRTAVSTSFSNLHLRNEPKPVKHSEGSSKRAAELASPCVAKDMAEGEMIRFGSDAGEMREPAESSQKARPVTPQKQSTLTQDVPATPALVPVVSPIGASIVSPLGTAPVASIAAVISQESESFASSVLARSPSNSRSSTKRSPNSHRTFKISSEPRGRVQSPANRITKPRARRKSPPPATAINDLVWSDSEITGHNPDDPNDDGYGINGIGFRPTPAMAERRRAQRRRQVAEWKKREDTDRRSKRREVRSEKHENVSSSQETGTDASDSKRVRFVESGEATDT